MLVFVCTMYRWGDKENHSYVVGVYSSMEQAKFAGSCEESYRGGKYSSEVLGFELDATVPQDIWEHHNGLHPQD